ncbi:unnamed protein product, partial [Ectocarpus sp. 12 AP-2014]
CTPTLKARLRTKSRKKKSTSATDPCQHSMPGRRSSAGRARGARRQSASQIQWRQASATQVAETGGLEVSGGNGYIDPLKAIDKLKKHGK